MIGSRKKLILDLVHLKFQNPQMVEELLLAFPQSEAGHIAGASLGEGMIMNFDDIFGLHYNMTRLSREFWRGKRCNCFLEIKREISL